MRAKLAKLEQEQRILEEKATASQARMEAESKAILQLEMPRLASADAALLRKSLQLLAITQAKQAERERLAWAATLGELGADPKAQRAAAKTSLMGGIAGRLIFQPYRNHEGSARSCRTAALAAKASDGGLMPRPGEDGAGALNDGVLGVVPNKGSIVTSGATEEKTFAAPPAVKAEELRSASASPSVAVASPEVGLLSGGVEDSILPADHVA
jgi:hypothetical protein